MKNKNPKLKKKRKYKSKKLILKMKMKILWKYHMQGPKFHNERQNKKRNKIKKRIQKMFLLRKNKKNYQQLITKIMNKNKWIWN